MSLVVWIDGELLEEDAARVSPFDHGLLTGDGVFETLRAYSGMPFAWTRHLERLRASADALGLHLLDEAVLREATEATMAANGIADGRLRITVTGGRAPLGSARGSGTPMTIVAAAPMDPPAPAVGLAVVPWSRNERGALAGVKSTSYAENVRALAFAAEHGAGEAVFANTRGNLCEATGSNVFLVKAGLVLTPPLSAGCLAGVTRALVLDCCAAEGIEAQEADVPIDGLARADEVFLTSTTREVQPVASVDDVMFSAAPGPVTARLAAAFAALVEADADP